MPVTLDKKTFPLPPALTQASTLADILDHVHSTLPPGRLITAVTLNGQLLEGPALTRARRDPLGASKITLASASQKDLSLTMLGKLAALIEWLSPQHREVAALFESGDTQRALDRLGSLLSAWQQIQTAYGNLAKLLGLSMKELQVREVSGEAVLNEFCAQLSELQKALTARDFVLLADILQYEMDGVVANWMALLESTLGVVEPVAA